MAEHVPEGAEPDLVLRGGAVITVDAGFSVAEAVAVRAGRILAVGTDGEVTSTAGPRTRVIDLAGGAVLPGINDSHLHGSMFGAYYPALWLDSFASGNGLPEAAMLDSDDKRRAALRRCWDSLLPLGITSYTEPGLGPGAWGQHGNSCDHEVLRVYTELARDGQIPVRVSALRLFGEVDGRSDLDTVLAGIADTEAGPSDVPNHWRVAGVKLFADGIPPMHNAWMRERYAGGADTGALLVDGADDGQRLAALRQMVRQAQRAGLQIGVHATGDRTIVETVRAFLDATAAGGPPDPRHYIIHGDCAPTDLLATMASAGIGLNSQPGIYAATMPMLEAAIGPERADRAAPVRSALAAGIPACLSSDGPVATLDWRQGIVNAVRRRCAPDGRVRGAHEQITVREAIRGYTIHGAWQDHAESWKGSIEVGKVADLCVLDRDPLVIEVEQIADAAVTMTIIDGEVCYDSSSSSSSSSSSAGGPRREVE